MKRKAIVDSPGGIPGSARPTLCIHEVFENRVLASDGTCALSWGKERLSYDELNRRSNALARELRRHGIGPEQPVALYLERSIEMIVAILAVLKSGGVYVPIDLAYPAERAEFMLRDCEAAVLITQSTLRSRLPQTGAEVICVDSDRDRISQNDSSNLPNRATPESAAYIIYTSGSTGQPKGVVVTHRNVVRLFEQTADWYRFNDSDVWPLFHSYAFDVSVWEIWGALFHGGRLVIVPHLITRSPHEFYQLLAHERVTVLNQTPSAFRQLIRAEMHAERKLELNLRLVICAGEALELQSLRPWFDIHGDERPTVVNMYGITETTVHSMYRPIRKADMDSGNGSVIGVPIPDLQIRLLDENLKPVPPGTPGEICVAGAGVARGYLKRPELTTSRFIPNTFDPSGRMYRSGDLARINASGEMEYLGRMDHQVKIRGFRVELGEIESALNSHPLIRESAVIARESGNEKCLTAYFVSAGEPPSVSVLREFLQKRLPDYMVPSAFVEMQAFPLTTNGKLDRRALPEPGHARPRLEQSFVAPRDEREKAIARIWSEVLGIGEIGIHDSFFELGGDSIRSIAILTRLKNSGLNFTLAQLFQNPTVEKLARCSPGGSIAKRTEPFSLIAPADREILPSGAEDAYPITRLQLGMFFHNELDPASAIYHDVFSFEFEAPFDRELLEQAIDRLAVRHAILRTSFHLAEFSEPLQIVHEDSRIPLTVEDLRSLDSNAQEQSITDWISAEKRRSFDRAKAPLIRFHAQLRGDRFFQLAASFHHACIDGWSLASLMTELAHDYRRLIASLPPDTHAPAVSYREFVELERTAIRSDEIRQFWSNYLLDAAVSLLPRWPKEMCAGGHEQIRGPEIWIQPHILHGLQRLARTAGTPLKSVLLAAHMKVMSVLHGSYDVLTGVVFNGRPEYSDGDRVVGLFLNTLPMRVRLKDSESWLGLSRAALAAEQEIIPHRRFPLAEIQKLNGGRPLFEAAFDYVHFHILNDSDAGSAGFREGPYFEANNLTTYTIFLLDPDASRLQFHIDYDPNIVPRKQIEEFSRYYVKTLEAMAANPLQRAATFSPLSEGEIQKMLRDWNATEQEFPRDCCIHELFEARVREDAQATAVICENKRLTYGELNERATQLAERLLDFKLDAGARIGILVNRSPQMLVALLATLKAGAAYVPLSTAFPKERVQQIVDDAGIAIVLTEAELASRFALPTEAVLLLDQPPTRETRQSRMPEVAPENLAYVIYTSGSTGTPKGVEITHRSVVNLLASMKSTVGFSEKDNLLAVTTLSFDIAALELFLPLISGGCVTIASSGDASDGSRLARLLESSSATMMQGTPATWRLLIEAGWRGNSDLKILCGGEALNRNLADDLLARGKEVWNVYGPTEATIWSTAWKVEADAPISIGRPLANTSVYVLDSHLQPLPVGVSGELFIGGEGVARQYWRQPALTEQKFISNPFSSAHARLYRTGDLARFRPDGTLQCLGRIDRQVKIRGFRIEPGEIEAALRRHEVIRDTLVIAQKNAFDEPFLVAFVISNDPAIHATALRGFLSDRLPHYMIPAYFQVVAEFPLLPGGKVDVRKLAAGFSATFTKPARDYAPPRSPDEETLAGIWKEALGHNHVGIHDHFMEVGGDSISATRMLARINNVFAMQISLADIFENPTVASQAAVVARLRGTATQTQIIPRRKRLVSVA